MKSPLEKLSLAFIQIGERYGMKDFCLPENGTAGMELKNGVRIFFEYAPAHSKLFLYTPLLKLPSDPANAAALFKTALECNFLQTSGDGEVAISRYFQEIVYQRRVLIDAMDADRLDQEIDALESQRARILAFLQQKTETKVLSSTAERIYRNRSLIQAVARK